MEENIENKHFKTENFDEALDEDENMNIGYSSDVSEHENKLEYNEKNIQTVKEQYIDEKIDKSPYKSNSDVVTSSNGPE